MVIEDVNDEIRNGMKTEEDSQLAYEKQMKVAKDLEEELQKRIVHLKVLITKRGEERVEEQADMGNNQLDLRNERDYKADIKPDCDWMIGAFEQRAEKRAAEMSGLRGAKDFLAGYKPTALVQSSEHRR